MNAQKVESPISNWDDLHLVLAVVRGGGLSGAARILGVHHATVLRRLDLLEHAMDVDLFERSARGYRPTVAGEQMALIASEIEERVNEAHRKAAGTDLRLTGTLRIATTEYLAITILPALLRDFRDAYPGIEVEMALSARFASLTKRDADVALRPTNDPPENLIGQRLCGMAYGVYGRADALPAGPPGARIKLEALPWIDVDESVSHSTPYRWRREHYPRSDAPVRYDALIGIFEAAKAGLGVAILPRFMAGPEPELIDLDPGAPEMELGLWLLTHPDLQKTQRVRAFMGFMAPAIRNRFREMADG